MARNRNILNHDEEYLTNHNNMFHDDSGLSLIDDDGAYSDRYDSAVSNDEYVPRFSFPELSTLRQRFTDKWKRFGERYFSRRMAISILRFAYSWSTWMVKFFSCYFGILFVFVILYAVLFWALTFRLILQSRSYSHQGISHPLSLDLSKSHPSADILVRQKWFIRHVHPRSTVKVSSIYLDFNIYKGWNLTTEKFTVHYEILDRNDKLIWDAKKSIVLPPSIMKLTKPRRWRFIPLLTSSENIDETTQVKVIILQQEDLSELEIVNKYISTAHLMRVSLDTNQIKIASSRLHLTPILSGYAYMIRHQLLLTILLMSVGLFCVVLCCYGVTITFCCCFCLRGKPSDSTPTTLTEASWSSSTYNRLRLRGNRSEGTREISETPHIRPSAPDLGMEATQSSLPSSELDENSEDESTLRGRRIQVEHILSESESDSEIDMKDRPNGTNVSNHVHSIRKRK